MNKCLKQKTYNNVFALKQLNLEFMCIRTGIIQSDLSEEQKCKLRAAEEAVETCCHALNEIADSIEYGVSSTLTSN